jgi:hypothetical protein
VSLFSKPRAILAAISLTREAERLGVEFEDLPVHLIADKFGPRANPVKWGLVPNAAVSGEPVREPALVAALDAVRAGRWEPAAELVAETSGDWNRRYAVVRALGDEAANDDEWLTEWRAERPGDGDAAAVHAEALVMMAWQIRGNARADSTTRAQFDGFHRVIAQAETAGRRATELLPADPTPWVTLIIVARALGYDHDEFGSLWDELVKRAPQHRAGHVQALQYWCEKWSGSHQLMMEFAVRAAAGSPELAFLPLDAATEWQHDNPAVWTSPEVRGALDVLLARLAGEGAATKVLRDDRGHAAYALIESGRHTEAVEQFRLIGSNAFVTPWNNADKPLLSFLLARADTCKKAGRAAR